MIVLAIPDTHSPFMHPGAVDFLSEINKKWKPKKVIHLGDEADQHALGRWGADPDGRSAGDEHKAILKDIKPLYKLFPKVEVCESNHGKRPYRKAFEAGIPKAYIRNYPDFMESPAGWTWHDDIEIDGVIYQHGEGYSGKMGALKCALDNRRSTVIGHIHSFAGVQYSATKRDTIFAVNAGCLIDVKAYAFAYAKVYPHKPTLGAVIVIDGREVIFIPFNK